VTNPTKYQQSYDFTGFQANNPNSPPPGVQIDIQLESIEQSIGQTVDALSDVRRSDGALQNGIVTQDSLCRPSGADHDRHGRIGRAGRHGQRRCPKRCRRRCGRCKHRNCGGRYVGHRR